MPDAKREPTIQIDPGIQIDIAADDLDPEKILNAITEDLEHLIVDDDASYYRKPAEPDEVSFEVSVDRDFPLREEAAEEAIAEPRAPEARLISAIEVVLTPDNPNSDRLYFTEDGEPLRETGTVSGRALRAERRGANDTIRTLTKEKDHWHSWAENHFERLKKQGDQIDMLNGDRAEILEQKDIAEAKVSELWMRLFAANRLLARAESLLGAPTSHLKPKQGAVLRWGKALDNHKKKTDKIK